MPHQTLKLIPGVDTTRTPVLNEAAISRSQLIRFQRDRGDLGALVQKLGGWERYYPTAMPSLVRALHAWQTFDTDKYLAAGCEVGDGANGYLMAIKGATSTDITPRARQDNVTVDVTTTLGSNVVTIVDTGSNVSIYDAIFIPAHISVGGVIVFGMYPCTPIDANTFEIELFDITGNPTLATAAVANGGAVAVFDTTNNDATVLVTLADHGYVPGDNYPVLIETHVGGVVLSGNYLVHTVPSSSTFTIVASRIANATATDDINNGDARYNFYVGYGPLPAGSGFGVGPFGVGPFGSGVAPAAGTGDKLDPQDWVLDSWGETLIALPTSVTFGTPKSDGEQRGGAPLFYWTPENATETAIPIANGPVSCRSFFIAMPQRQIIALGASTYNNYRDPLMVRWCDVNNFNVWNPTPTNSARSYRIPRGSAIIGGLQAGQQGIIWTDIGVWVMQFAGGDAVYNFNEIATGCGLIARKACATRGGVTYWMGTNQFFALTGNGVEPLSCPVWDHVFQNLHPNGDRKIRAAPNSSFNEIAWYYASKDGDGEVDSYVKYNSSLGPDNGWDFGRLCRTAWIDQSILGQPIGADENGLIQQHEISNNADGLPLVSSFRTGVFTLSDGDLLMFVDQFWPDMEWGQFGDPKNAQIKVSFIVSEYFGSPPRTYGPYTISKATKYITPRFRGRLVQLEFESDDIDTFWRIGANRYRVAPDGKFL